jgi:hypothetical protein
LTRSQAFRPLKTSSDLSSWTELAARAAEQRDRDFVASPFALEAARVAREQGVAGRAELLRRVMKALIDRGRPRIATLNLPDTVKALIAKEYRRIELDLSKATDEHYDLAHHTTRCDFRIAGFGRIPVGLHHIEVGGVPRRLLFSGGGAQIWRAASLLAGAGGWAPFYVSHFTHGIKPWAFLMAYTPDALATWHRNAAECLRMNPRIRGLLATSWWYDPQLTRVAPHLSFLREGSLEHGAILLRAGSSAGARAYAVANSPERRRLYEAGEYLPVSYAVAWTRDALLKWAG